MRVYHGRLTYIAFVWSDVCARPRELMSELHVGKLQQKGDQ